MNAEWITIQEAASLCSVPYETMKKSIQRGKFVCMCVNGKGRGGKQLRILLESLPQEAQDRYYGITPDRPALETSNTYTSLSDKQRKRVDEKVLAVTEYTKFKRQYHKQGVTREFLKRFSEAHPEIDVNMDKLEDWVNKYAENGIEGLIDRRGRHNKGSSSLTEEMQDIFNKYYLTDKKPSINQCYTATRDYFKAKGVEVPSISAFKRFVYSLPADVTAFYRDGKKYYDDNFMPSIFTDYGGGFLYSNREWIGDHHLCDVLVNHKGKILRPWLSAWLDRKSRYVVGYVLNPCEPNADIVLDSFAAAVKNCGVPDTIQIDNGKDYKAHDLFNKDNDYSLVSALKADVRTSNPYNAKAKSIERFFRTFESYNKMLPSYIGDRPENRPTSMQGTNVIIERQNKAMSFEEFKEYVADVINVYNNTPHSGDGMENKSPCEIYRSSFVKPMRELNESARRLLLRRTTRTVTITKQGVKFAELPNIKYYYSDELLFYGIGKKVYARYDINDVTEIYIYAETGEYICTAKNDILNVYGVGKEVSSQIIRENNNRKKALLKRTKSYYPDIEEPSITEVVANRSASFGIPDFSQIPKTDYSKEIEMPNEQKAQTEESEEFAYPEKDYRLNLGNIGKTAM